MCNSNSTPRIHQSQPNPAGVWRCCAASPLCIDICAPPQAHLVVERAAQGPGAALQVVQAGAGKRHRANHGDHLGEGSKLRSRDSGWRHGRSTAVAEGGPAAGSRAGGGSTADSRTPVGLLGGAERFKRNIHRRARARCARSLARPGWLLHETCRRGEGSPALAPPCRSPHPLCASSRTPAAAGTHRHVCSWRGRGGRCWGLVGELLDGLAGWGRCETGAAGWGWSPQARRRRVLAAARHSTPLRICAGPLPIAFHCHVIAGGAPAGSAAPSFEDAPRRRPSRLPPQGHLCTGEGQQRRAQMRGEREEGC